MFSAGSIFINLGGRLLPEGFDGFDRRVLKSAATKAIYVDLGAKNNPAGFQAFNKEVQGSATAAKGLQTQATRSMEAVAAEAAHMSEAVARATGVMSQRLGILAGNYHTIAAAAQHSADAQVAAAEQASAAAEENAAKIAAAEMETTRTIERETKKQVEARKAGFATASRIGKISLLGGGIVGILSAKEAGDFQKNMLLIRTEANGTQKDVGILSKQLLELAPKVAQSPNELAKGLYRIASAGHSTKAGADGVSEAFRVLKTAAEGAAIGNAKLEDVSNVLSSIWRNHPKDLRNVTEAMGVMIKTVGQGNLRMNDLVKAMGSGVVGAAVGVGLGFRDVAAALDVMTARGVPAEMGANRLRTTLSLIHNPTKKARDALAEIGITADQLATSFHQHGLVKTLETLQAQMDKTFPKKGELTQKEYANAVKEYGDRLAQAGVEGKRYDVTMDAFKKKLKDTGVVYDENGNRVSALVHQSQLLAEAFGGARMGTTMQILMQHLGKDGLTGVMEHLGNHMEASRATTKAFDETTGNFNFKVKQLWTQIQVLGVELGQKLVPIFLKVIHAVQDAAHWFGKHKEIAHDLAIAIGVVLAGAITTFFVGLGIKLANSLIKLKDYVKWVATLGDRLTGLGRNSETAAKAQDPLIVALDRTTAAIEGNVTALEAQATAAAEAEASMGRLAATGEAVTAGGVVLPPGVTSGTSRVKGEQARGPGGRYSRGATMERGTPLFGPSGRQVAQEEQAIAQEEAAVAPVAARPGAIRRGGNAIARVGGRAVNGLMVGIMGNMAANMLGDLLGGKAGNAVSNIGGDAATGAGIGMVAGPWGAVAGAIAGGLVGAFNSVFKDTHIEDYGKKITDQIQKGMDPLHLKVSATVDASTKKNIIKHAETIAKLRDVADEHSYIDQKAFSLGKLKIDSNLTPESKAKLHALIQEQFDGLGREAARYFNNGMEHGPKFQTAGTFLAGMKQALSGLPEESKKAALKSMTEMAGKLELEGRLPHGATKHLVENMLLELGVFPGKAKEFAKNALDEIETVLKQNKVVAHTKNLVDDINKQFADAPKVGKINAENMTKVWTKELDFLSWKMHHGTKEMRDKAAEQWKLVWIDAGKYSKLMRSDADKQLSQMFKFAGTGFFTMADNANSAFVSVASAAAAISTDVNKLASSLGAKGVHFTPAKTPKGQQAQLHAFNLTLPDFSDSGGVIGGATGLNLARVARKFMGGIPNPGSGSADDHLVIGPHGDPVAAISGTEGIINAPQMGIVDHALNVASAVGAIPHRYSSLDGLWASGMRHLATGGYVFPMRSFGSQGRLDRGQDMEAARGYETTVALGSGTITRRSLGFSTELQLDSGKFKGHKVFYGHNSALLDPGVGHHVRPGDPIGKTGGAPFAGGTHTEIGFTDGSEGISGPWGGRPPAIGAVWMHNLLAEIAPQFIKGVAVPGQQSQSTGPGGAPGKATAALSLKLSPMSITGAGAFGDIARAALAKMRKAGSAYLTKAAGSSSGGPSGGTAWHGKVDVPLDPVTPQSWARALLGSLGDPTDARHVDQVVRWENAEGGHWHNSARFNPLNTTQKMPGYSTFQSVGAGAAAIGIYRSWKQGMQATLTTLANGLYGPILASLKSGSGLGPAVGSTRWGTGNFAGGGLLSRVRRLAGGGRLNGLQGGGALQHSTHTVTPAHHPAAHKPKKTKLPGRVGGPPVHPHGVLKLGKFESLIPGVADLDEADLEIAKIDRTYTDDSTYFQLVDQSLTPGDYSTLLNLRGQQRGALVKEDLSLEGMLANIVGVGAHIDAGGQIVADDGTPIKAGGMLGRRQHKLAAVQAQAHKVANRINTLKAQLKAEGRKIATTRHKKAKQLAKIANDLAVAMDKNWTARHAIATKIRNTRDSWQAKITQAEGQRPGSISAKVKAIHDSFAPRIAAARGARAKKALENQRDQAITALQNGHTAAVAAHASRIKALQQGRTSALHPLQVEQGALQKHGHTLSVDLAKKRRKYQKQGFNAIWAETLKKWKLQDKLQAAREEENALSGSTTHVGKGGDIGVIKQEIAALISGGQAVETKLSDNAGSELDIALGDVDTAGQAATLDAAIPSGADAAGAPTYTDRHLLDYLADADEFILQQHGFDMSKLHRTYRFNKDTNQVDVLQDSGALAGAAGLVPTATDAGTPSDGTPTPAEIAAAAVQELSSMGSAASDIMAQFGSNMVSRGGLGAALTAPGGFGNPTRYFGAAGARINLGLGLDAAGGPPTAGLAPPVTQTFEQHNHYDSGPEDPHIHSQMSRLEFMSVFS